MKKHTAFRTLAFRGGSYSLILIAVVLAILIVLNVFTANLPATATKLDISATKLYSITSNTKAVVHSLQQDVTVYWIVQSEQEDTILENLLAKYESLSSRIQVTKKNPDVFPTFTQQYTQETVPNNSLIVVSGERYRYISYSDLYETELNYYTYSYVATGFAGEAMLTSAIDYVVTQELPVLYTVEGHGEGALPETFADAVEKANIQTESLSLLTVDAVPADGDAVLIYAPETDISEAERDMLLSYAESGGKLLVISGPVKEGSLTNLNSLLTHYGVTVVDGIVIEADRSSYAAGYPYALLPERESTTITDPLIEEGYYPVMAIAQGLQLGAGTTGTVTALLTTSGTSFSKSAGYNLTTYEQEEGDTAGPFALAVSVETAGSGQLLWFASDQFLNEGYNTYSSGANVNLVMNGLSSLIGEREAIAIRSRSLDYNYLTIDEETASTLKALMIGILPLGYLGIGVAVTLCRRRKQNETV